jgi:PEP-CTERM motif
MFTRLTRTFTTLAALTFCSVMASARPAAADIIKIDVTGNYTRLFLGSGSTVYGVTQAPPIPFDYSITYDTGLGSVIFAPAGTIDGGSPTQHDLYGYSAAGIIAMDVTFGNETFTASQMNPRGVPGGGTAAFLTDAPLTGSPTFFLADFNDPARDADLRIASLFAPGAQFGRGIRLLNNISNGEADASDFTVTTTNLSTVVPEPTTMLLLGTGLIAVATRLRPSARG